MKPVIILPYDGYESAEKLVISCANFFKTAFATQLVAFIKLNDALHFRKVGPEILAMLSEVKPTSVRYFIDLKIPDVLQTDKNILRHYVEFKPAIVTVSSIVASKSLMAVKEILPETKIALVDTLTDIPEDECLKRYGIPPLEKISKALSDFDELLKNDNPIEMVVCSPRETKELKRRFSQYEFVNAGIRSRHMAKDHQERITSAYDALKNGADWLVMGTQIEKGNPKGGISPEESQKITLEEIEQYFKEKL
ncbi:MAG: hypothetical protein A2271_03840 [Candidatus Moranbacteria bacterium RIFOXYA12_FULL_35_19]|nr:MAG: Orotidine 5'-phosphate decarboxylase [Candidatus Moranbacteria bacterium GW2011_GWF2_35_39]OGI32100.1 MAG: hypothetical protein A2343_02240 [Candidatus Moranbacteria bacterium RIFOXYB12_FULL_35_8]OGI33346.1 MAG: hypothetical protein A2489_03775 [Candidatus Moranbacteria bacterium RIFOXYC12_FULL_36_13]OGI36304.1 MAG: hypothetical protein A2271_03840 [Candidatus Moranbacteria bacterium RIFOXYA12_FULL_35_19]